MKTIEEIEFELDFLTYINLSYGMDYEEAVQSAKDELLGEDK